MSPPAFLLFTRRFFSLQHGFFFFFAFRLCSRSATVVKIFRRECFTPFSRFSSPRSFFFLISDGGFMDAWSGFSVPRLVLFARRENLFLTLLVFPDFFYLSSQDFCLPSLPPGNFCGQMKACTQRSFFTKVSKASCADPQFGSEMLVVTRVSSFSFLCFFQGRYLSRPPSIISSRRPPPLPNFTAAFAL